MKASEFRDKIKDLPQLKEYTVKVSNKYSDFSIMIENKEGYNDMFHIFIRKGFDRQLVVQEIDRAIKNIEDKTNGR